MKGFRLGRANRLPWLTSILVLLLSACGTGSDTQQGKEIRFLVGSDLGEFCKAAAEKLNQTKPKLSDGEPYFLSCEAKGSGDVVNDVLSLAQQLQRAGISADDPQFPTLVAVDGEIYQSQLRFQMEKLFPGQDYIPRITDSSLVAFSPMVFMTTAELAPSLANVDNLYTALVEASNHQELDPAAPALPITYVHTAPTRSNSGLQTLVAQFSAIANKPPEDLTLQDVQKYQAEVSAIQSKITRYGKSTGSLARAIARNGPFWASVGSVYESLIIEANNNSGGGTQFVAVYPDATFSSNIRAILSPAPWVDAQEKEAAEAIIAFMLKPETQQIAADLGLRPGTPGVQGSKFTPQFGVQSAPQYESLRPPQPEVVEAMLTSWQNFAKKPSQVVIVVDVSGSMGGDKLAVVKNTLFQYINTLGPKEAVALISFSSDISEPIQVDGSAEGKQKAINFINQLEARGGTSLYDSALYARNWVQQNLRPNTINAVLILTDGEDSSSRISLEQLEQQLMSSNYESGQNIAFFTVGYGEEGEFNAQALTQIAEVNGGYYRKGDPTTIGALMADLQVEF
ncbi:MAG: VWA domain-containing protein [Cyanobacteria bacterium P01_H01_bin.15]